MVFFQNRAARCCGFHLLFSVSVWIPQADKCQKMESCSPVYSCTQRETHRSKAEKHWKKFSTGGKFTETTEENKRSSTSSDWVQFSCCFNTMKKVRTSNHVKDVWRWMRRLLCFWVICLLVYCPNWVSAHFASPLISYCVVWNKEAI